jgi:integrase/recombinase XerD
VRSLFSFAALRAPEHAELIARVLSIPAKRCDRAVVSWLAAKEVDALLAAPDRATWTGRRDHALLVLACQTGLRVSELSGLDCQDARLGVAPT